MDKYYVAYGSNLSLEQMARRCPGAYPVGYTVLGDCRLLFKGSKTGSYLTVEPCKDRKVEALVWAITEVDEKNLDRYEGCPDFYYKKTITVPLLAMHDYQFLEKVEAIIYIMHEDRPLGCPSARYYDICMEGYQRLEMDVEFLRTALRESTEGEEGYEIIKRGAKKDDA